MRGLHAWLLNVDSNFSKSLQFVKFLTFVTWRHSWTVSLNIPIPDLFSIFIWRRERTQRLPRRAGIERTKRFRGCTLTTTTLLLNIKSFSAIFNIFFPSACKISPLTPGESGSLDLMLAMMKDVREDIERLKEKVFQWGMRKKILYRAVIHVCPCNKGIANYHHEIQKLYK